MASVKSRLVLPFWYRLTRVVLDKGPLNVCVCVCVFGTLSFPAVGTARHVKSSSASVPLPADVVFPAGPDGRLVGLLVGGEEVRTTAQNAVEMSHYRRRLVAAALHVAVLEVPVDRHDDLHHRPAGCKRNRHIRHSRTMSPLDTT